MDRLTSEHQLGFAASKLIWIWALSIVVGIIVVLGFIALIVPGIILTIMFSAFPVLTNREQRSPRKHGAEPRARRPQVAQDVRNVHCLRNNLHYSFGHCGAISGPFGVAKPVVSGILSGFYQPLFPILITVYYYSSRYDRISPPLAYQMPTQSITTV